VSAATGEGMPAFFEAVAAASEDYRTGYLAELTEAAAERRILAEKKRQADIARLKADLEKDEAAAAAASAAKTARRATGGASSGTASG
jgi:hypothetical protein